MRRSSRRFATVTTISLLIALLGSAAGSPVAVGVTDRHVDEPLTRTFRHLDRDTKWELTERIALDSPTHHPQGFALVGGRIFMSTVEIIKAPVPYDEPRDGYDRTPGKGRGHLFVLDRDGQLLKDIVISDGNRYHPGGLDYDGEFLWLPVAEYRPNSSADIYRIDPTTYDVTKLFTVSDHIGGVVRDQETGHLVGQSWGSRRFYDWTVGGRQKRFWLNENHFLDYQDCEYVASRKALCSGVTGLPAQPGAATGYELGGLVMIDLRDRHRLLHEVPLQQWSTAGHVITRNPTDLDADGSHLTLYAAPDDSGEAAGTQILVYEADVTPLS